MSKKPPPKPPARVRPRPRPVQKPRHEQDVEELLRLIKLEKELSPSTTTGGSPRPKGVSLQAKPVPADRVGDKCPVCGTKFTAKDWVITCPHCRSIYHDRGGEDNCWNYNNGCAMPFCPGKIKT